MCIVEALLLSIATVYTTAASVGLATVASWFINVI